MTAANTTNQSAGNSDREARLEAGLAEVRRRLQAAVELELSTLPPYLVAAASIRPGTNAEAHNRILSVYMEEMLHMLLAGNVLSAVGGKVHLGADNIPQYPLRLQFDGVGFKRRQFDIDLAPLSPRNLETFLNIELPDGFNPVGHTALEPGVEKEDEFPGYTIGEFYEDIIARLGALCGEFGEDAVFVGDHGAQLDQRFFWYGGGKPITVTNLETATKALLEIVHQGEGSKGNMDDGDARGFGQSPELAHYFRFNEIYAGRKYRADDSIHGAPTGDPIEVDYSAVVPFKPNPRQAEYAPNSDLAHLNQQFNGHYSFMLSQIAEAINGNGYTLYNAIKSRMVFLLPLMRQMMSIPIPGDAQGWFGAPSFEWVEPLREG